MKKQQKVQKKAQQKIEKSVWDSLDLPQGKRTKLYRFFEILPGFTSYMILLLLVIFSLISPVLGSYYLLFIIATTLVKAVGITFQKKWTGIRDFWIYMIHMRLMKSIIAKRVLNLVSISM